MLPSVQDFVVIKASSVVKAEFDTSQCFTAFVFMLYNDRLPLKENNLPVPRL